MSARKGWPVGLILAALVILAACSSQSAIEDEAELVEDEATIEEQGAPAEEEIETTEAEVVEEDTAEEPPAEEEATEDTEEQPAEEEVAEVQAPEGQCVSVSESSTTIRRAPEAEGKVLGYLAEGQGFQVLNIDNEEWLKVVPPEKYANFRDLWVWQGATEPMSCSALDTFITDPLAQPEALIAGSCAVVTASSVSIRLVPKVEAYELGFASEGEVFEVLTVENEEWIKIRPPEKYAFFPELWMWSGALELATCEKHSTGATSNV